MKRAKITGSLLLSSWLATSGTGQAAIASPARETRETVAPVHSYTPEQPDTDAIREMATKKKKKSKGKKHKSGASKSGGKKSGSEHEGPEGPDDHEGGPDND